MEISDWFKGFEKGIARLSSQQRETLFTECGKNCVKCGSLQIYKDVYDKAFFTYYTHYGVIEYLT